MEQHEAVALRHGGHASATTPVPALERGLWLLRVLADASAPLTLSELSDAIGASRSTVYSLLATLQHHGMVEKDSRYKTYRLGVATLEIGSAYLQRVSLVPVFTEVAQRLVALCRETVKLAVLDGRDVVYIGKQEGLNSVRLVARVGTRMHAHATAVGKVLLGQQTDDQLGLLYVGYGFPARTPHTLATFNELLTQVRAARQQGYAYDDEESTLGVRCVAAPIRDHSRAIVAAMSIGVPNDRIDGARMHELRELLLEHARQISRQLGGAERLESEVADVQR
jgi:IclR family transcriptional regulator, KDG regulon repressor